MSKWGISIGHEKESERERNSGRECVCSCSLVCLVQNWFKAPGHRKKAALHSRHVPETSSRGSTIAIQQRRLQTPKWVCSVLQCPTWQSATYSTSLAPNMPSPSCCYFSILSSSLSFPFSASFSLSVANLHLQSYRISLPHTHPFLVCPMRFISHLSPFLYIHGPSCPANTFWLVTVLLLQDPSQRCQPHAIRNCYKACRCVACHQNE